MKKQAYIVPSCNVYEVEIQGSMLNLSTGDGDLKDGGTYTGSAGEAGAKGSDDFEDDY